MTFVDFLKFGNGFLKKRTSKGEKLWSINIIFQLFEYKNLQVEPKIGLNDIDLGTNLVEELVGKSFTWDEKYFYSGADASFYTVEHDNLKFFKVDFGQIKDKFIQTRIETTIDFSGFESSDKESSLQLKFPADLQIE